METGLHELLKFVYLWAIAVACILVARRYIRGSADDERKHKKPLKAPVVIAAFVVMIAAFLTADPLVSLILN